MNKIGSKPTHILLMKVGPYCGYSLKQIVDIKQKEISKCGKFYWGYSGVFCRPKTIYAYVNHAKIYNQKPLVYFITTQSSYKTTSEGKFGYFSVDKSKWKRLPEDILLVGNKSKPHFAITANKLKPVNKVINLAEYCTFSGMFPDPNKYLDRYFRYRVDKACGFYLPKNSDKKTLINISYSCELVEPYSVFIK